MAIVKIKIGELNRINDALKEIIENKELQLDNGFKFRILGIMKSLEIPIANFTIVKNEKILEYGTKDSEGNVRITPDDTEAIEKFNHSISKIANEETEVHIDLLKQEEIFMQGLNIQQLLDIYCVIEK